MRGSAIASTSPGPPGSPSVEYRGTRHVEIDQHDFSILFRGNRHGKVDRHESLAFFGQSRGDQDRLGLDARTLTAQILDLFEELAFDDAEFFDLCIGRAAGHRETFQSKALVIDAVECRCGCRRLRGIGRGLLAINRRAILGRRGHRSHDGRRGIGLRTYWRCGFTGAAGWACTGGMYACGAGACGVSEGGTRSAGPEGGTNWPRSKACMARWISELCVSSGFCG
jgi:hypothetical protein